LAASVAIFSKMSLMNEFLRPRASDAEAWGAGPRWAERGWCG